MFLFLTWSLVFQEHHEGDPAASSIWNSTKQTLSETCYRRFQGNLKEIELEVECS